MFNAKGGSASFRGNREGNARVRASEGRPRGKAAGFTLIELLIVVAIIAILAAIAVPNFLEAQVRAKITRAKSDHRTLATGLEAYMVDQNKYPPGRDPSRSTSERVVSLFRLTTPVAYITNSDMIDPFITIGVSESHAGVNMYLYFSYTPVQYSGGGGNWSWAIRSNAQFTSWGPHAGWCLSSPGPDRRLNGAEWIPLNIHSGNFASAYRKIYDSTNGTKSAGDIARYGGDVGIAAVLN